MRDSWQKQFPLVTEGVIRDFARAIGDTNPIHRDHTAAAKIGLRGIIAPGVMVIGHISSAIAEEAPCVRVRRLEVEFLAPLYAGSHPLVSCTVSRRRGNIVFIAIEVKDGAEMIARGECFVITPKL